MDNDKIITQLPVTIFGNLEKFNEVISKGRCRIFYKGANRNGTFITDEFAERLLATIPYAPIKGIYDIDEQDFTDHGESRDLGRIYGVVPFEPNLAWEKHVDEDGVEREYATVDVLIYTGLYSEANQIVGKSQSMELYYKSIQGDWKYIEGKKYYVYSDACFLGLQALGDEVEPCFEGSAFFSLYTSLKDFVNKIESDPNFSLKGQGGDNMPNVNFKLSDNKKCQMLWELLNTQFNEEGNWTVGYDICEVYDDYAVVHNFYENQFERVYYKKDDESDSLEITARKRCYIIDVTEDEKKALDAIHNLNNSSFEKIDELYTNLQAENSENGTKLEECNASIATLTTERDNALEQLTAANAKLDELTEQYTAVNAQVEELNAQYTASQNDMATISAERDALATYKKEVELAEKKRIIGNYTEQLNADVIDEFTAKIDDMSAEELDMKLTYMVKKTHPEIFSNQPAVMYVPKDVPRAGIETILDKYEKH